MCGICGVVLADRDAVVATERIVAMRDALRHRGPDDEAVFVDGNVALGHTRLSIIDLSPQGRQPFTSNDGRYHVVFNGEIYNYRELRRELERDGHAFRTQTDTEVLLACYMHRGTSMLDALNGMFAFGIWDSHERSLFLARDRMGVKPLYIAQEHGSFLFASEPKSLFAGGVEPDIDATALDELLMFRFIAGERTLFRTVRRLRPGHAMMVVGDSVRTWRWWNLAERAMAAEVPRDPVAWFGATFDESIRYRLISDVPVGILLSGGIDSTSVAASSALQGHADVATFTVAFDEAGYDESQLARSVAAQYHLPHHELTLRDAELHDALEAASWYLDEPVAHQNDPQLLAIARLAKQHVSVLLSGEGSDETLGGYVRYQPLRHLRILQWGSGLLPLLPALGVPRRRVEKLRRYLHNGDLEHLLLYNSCNFYPDDMRALGIEVAEQHFDARRSAIREAMLLYPDAPHRQSMYADQHVFLCSLLDRNDRTTMGASIECREPFLDHRIVETLAALPPSLFVRGKKGKHLLVNALGHRLPREVRRYRKWGFAVPWERSMRGLPRFREEVERMHRSPVFEQGVLARLDVKALTNAFVKGDDSNMLLVRQLYMIDVWHRTYFEKLRELKDRSVDVLVH